MWSTRRDAFLDALKAERGVAVIPTNSEALRNGTSHFRFRPDSNFFYLTGFGEPEAVAVFLPHHPEHRYVLFVRPRDKAQETWTGRRAGVEGARERFEADAAFPIEELEERLPELLKDAQSLYYPLGHHPDTDRLVQTAMTAARRFRKMGTTTPTSIHDPGVLLGEARLFKSDDELAQMERAAQISAEAHIAAMRATRPGATEGQIEALIEFTFRSQGGVGPAYNTIVGAGDNATILHYIENKDPLRAGDLLLVDAGCEYGYYCADLTRTWPVNGRFTGPQRDLYDVVLASQEAAIERVRPGQRFIDPHETAVEILTRGMIDLGLITGSLDEALETRAYQRFYMHKTGHWLGMDVHDVGEYYEAGADGERASRTFSPGMVTTVEPGIYVPLDDAEAPEAFRGIGIRIEDDVQVTAGAPKILTKGCPKAPHELEALVGTGDGPLAALNRAS